jgi:hypothetical protein
MWEVPRCRPASQVGETGYQVSSLTRMLSASVGPQDGPAVIECWLDDAPGAFDNVLPREATQRSLQRIIEQPLVRVLSLTEGSCEVDVDVDLFTVHIRAGGLGLQGECNAVVLAETQPDQVASGWGPTGLVEQHPRRIAQFNHDLGCVLFERFADADVPRDAGPAPRIDLEACRRERFDFSPVCHTWLVSIADVLSAYECVAVHWPHGGEDLGFLVLQESTISTGRWFHRQERDDLQKMILEDVAYCAD